MFYEFQRKTVVGDENEEAGGGGQHGVSSPLGCLDDWITHLSSCTLSSVLHSSLRHHSLFGFPPPLQSRCSYNRYNQPAVALGADSRVVFVVVLKGDSTSLQTLSKMKKMSQLIYVTFDSFLFESVSCSLNSAPFSSSAVTSASPPPAVASQRPSFPSGPTSTGKPADCRQMSPHIDSNPSLRCGKRPLAASLAAGFGNTWDPWERAPLLFPTLTRVHLPRPPRSKLHL